MLDPGYMGEKHKSIVQEGMKESGLRNSRLYNRPLKQIYGSAV